MCSARSVYPCAQSVHVSMPMPHHLTPSYSIATPLHSAPALRSPHSALPPRRLPPPPPPLHARFVSGDMEALRARRGETAHSFCTWPTAAVPAAVSQSPTTVCGLTLTSQNRALSEIFSGVTVC